jgi:hypothetical protein
MNLNFCSPADAENVPFDLGAYVLLLWIHRDEVDFKDLNEFMSDGNHQIVIKDKYLDLPVFRRSFPKGIHVHDSEPMKCGAIGRIINSSIRKCGYGKRVLFYQPVLMCFQKWQHLNHLEKVPLIK